MKAGVGKQSFMGELKPEPHGEDAQGGLGNGADMRLGARCAHSPLRGWRVSESV